MASLVEARMVEIARSERSKMMIVHNNSWLLRTYPDGSRVSSSNFDPMIMWGVGCQITCLNYQVQIPMSRFLPPLWPDTYLSYVACRRGTWA